MVSSELIKQKKIPPKIIIDNCMPIVDFGGIINFLKSYRIGISFIIRPVASVIA